MLLQSQHGCIEVLPALPTAWANGSFSGLKALGGAEVSAEWKEGAVEWMTVKATHEGDFHNEHPRKAASPQGAVLLSPRPRRGCPCGA